jgi:hypothetical protein
MLHGIVMDVIQRGSEVSVVADGSVCGCAPNFARTLTVFAVPSVGVASIQSAMREDHRFQIWHPDKQVVVMGQAAPRMRLDSCFGSRFSVSGEGSPEHAEA